METLSDTLRRLRNERGWSLRELACRSHLSASYLCYLEKGKRPLTREAADRLAEAFVVDSDGRPLLESLQAWIAEETERKRVIEQVEKARFIDQKSMTFEREIRDFVHILRKGQLASNPYQVVEPGPLRVLDNGRTYFRRSLIEVGGELFEVELKVSRYDPDQDAVPEDLFSPLS